MEIEHYIKRVIEETEPEAMYFHANNYEFNQQIETIKDQDVSFPIIFFDKSLTPRGSFGRSAFKERARVTLIIFSAILKELEISNEQQQKYIDSARDTARRIILQMSVDLLTEINGELVGEYELPPVYYHSDAHLIGCGANFTIEYYPEIIC